MKRDPKIIKAVKWFIRNGFYVFPLNKNSKRPSIKDWPNKASRDYNDFKGYWESGHNIGIYTGKYLQHQALIVVDIDNKKNGHKNFAKIKSDKKFPLTITQDSPGGSHVIYLCNSGVKNSVNKIAMGIDIRSTGGYIVGAGSVVNGKRYKLRKNNVYKPTFASSFLVYECDKAPDKSKKNKVVGVIVDLDSAVKRGVELLKNTEFAVEGAGGDCLTYILANKLKDLGLSEDKTLDLLVEHWNDKCSPPWAIDDLKTKVTNAYLYGIESQGSNSPEAHFKETNSIEDEESFIEMYNKRFALLAFSSRSIIVDFDGNRQFLGKECFKDLVANESLQDANSKYHKASKLWLEHPYRRTYKKIDFLPGKKYSTRYFKSLARFCHRT